MVLLIHNLFTGFLPSRHQLAGLLKVQPYNELPLFKPRPRICFNPAGGLRLQHPHIAFCAQNMRFCAEIQPIQSN